MCHQTTCRRCNKPTWSGCGNHIEQALKGVPTSERCACAEEPATGGFFSRMMKR